MLLAAFRALFASDADLLAFCRPLWLGDLSASPPLPEMTASDVDVVLWLDGWYDEDDGWASTTDELLESVAAVRS